MIFADLSKLEASADKLVEIFERIAKVLEANSPKTAGANAFKAGYVDSDESVDNSWIGTTDEVSGFLREHLSSQLGREVTQDEYTEVIKTSLPPDAYPEEIRASGAK